jgi:hypothetical protein
MKVAHIAPPHGVNWISDKSYHFTVAPMLAGELSYQEFYKLQHERGAFVIVDNGEAEYALSQEISARPDFEEVVKVANVIKADEICMPDVMYDARETKRRVVEYIELVEPRRRMMVPQGNDIQEWMDCCEFLLDFGCRSIGIPKHMERFGRHLLCQAIESRGWQKYWDFHLLGVWNNAREELMRLVEFPWIRGIDTGIAFAYAQRDMRLERYAGVHVGLTWDGISMPDRVVEANMQVLEAWACGNFTQ